MRGRLAAASALAVLLVALAATVGSAAASAGAPPSAAAAPSAAATAPPAAEPTRAEYVKALEGICKPRALATQRAMKGARGDVSAERLAVAAGKFGSASRLFGTTVKLISAVPRPAADATRLGKWFVYLNQQASYLRRIVTDLRADRAVPAQRLTARFIHNGNLANNAVLAFGFEYCSFKFSRYG